MLWEADEMGGVTGTAAQGMLKRLRGVGVASHAYIICGDGDREGAARAMAAAMLCRADGPRPCGVCPSCGKADAGAHPDIIIVEKPGDKKEIPIDNVRDIIKDTAVLPNESDRKAYIFREASQLSVVGQNTLLKTLEEPPAHAAFILAAKDPSALLPTVRSRCVELTVGAVAESGAAAVTDDSEAAREASAAVERFFTALDSGALAFVTEAFALEKLDRTAFTEFVEQAREAAARRVVGEAGARPESGGDMWRVLRALNLARDYLRLNVSTGHITGMFCALLMPRNERNGRNK
jgi:hypothetical protein